MVTESRAMTTENAGHSPTASKMPKNVSVTALQHSVRRPRVTIFYCIAKQLAKGLTQLPNHSRCLINTLHMEIMMKLIYAFSVLGAWILLLGYMQDVRRGVNSVQKAILLSTHCILG